MNPLLLLQPHVNRQGYPPPGLGQRLNDFLKRAQSIRDRETAWIEAQLAQQQQRALEEDAWRRRRELVERNENVSLLTLFTEPQHLDVPTKGEHAESAEEQAQVVNGQRYSPSAGWTQLAHFHQQGPPYSSPGQAPPANRNQKLLPPRSPGQAQGVAEPLCMPPPSIIDPPPSLSEPPRQAPRPQMPRPRAPSVNVATFETLPSDMLLHKEHTRLTSDPILACRNPAHNPRSCKEAMQPDEDPCSLFVAGKMEAWMPRAEWDGKEVEIVKDMVRVRKGGLVEGRPKGYAMS